MLSRHVTDDQRCEEIQKFFQSRQFRRFDSRPDKMQLQDREVCVVDDGSTVELLLRLGADLWTFSGTKVG